MSTARFKIRNITTGGAWSAFAAGGFDASEDDVLEVQLEDQPALDVYACAYATTVASKAAPALSFATSGIPTTPAAALRITVPSLSGAAASWRVTCTTNNGASVAGPGGRPDFTANQKARIVSVRAGGRRKIVVGESTEYDPVFGWTAAQNDDVDAGGGGGGGTCRGRFVVPASITAPTTTDTGWSRAGIVNFDPSKYPATVDGRSREIVFATYLEVQTGGGFRLGAQVRLVNLDTGDVVSTFSGVATPADPPSDARVPGDITVPSDIPNALQTYEVQLRRTDGDAGDRVTCSLAQFEVTY
jgi:hypothetical protein